MHRIFFTSEIEITI